MRAVALVAIAVALIGAVAVSAGGRSPLARLRVNHHIHHQRQNGTLGFDQATATRYVYYSFAAYQVSQIMSWSCSYCTAYGPASTFQPSATFYAASTDANGYIGVNPDFNEIVVVFRGSHSLQNWIDNLNVAPVSNPFGPGQVHGGFLGVYQSIQSQVVNALAALAQQYPSYSIVVTGHSLGGAVTALCVADLMVNQGYTSVSALTFGEPRVGDPTFAKWLVGAVGSVTRVVHADDIVPHVPPELLGYQHETQEIWNPSGTNFVTCSATNGEDGNCADSVPIWDFSVGDHLLYMQVPCCDGPTSAITLPELSRQ